MASPWESEAEFSEKSFKKAQKDPSARSQLENIHSARAFKYCTSHFGPKSWYKRIRISHWNLKIGIVENSAKVEMLIFDFVNQLNVMDLNDRLPEGLKLFKFEEHFYHAKAEFLL